MKKLVFLFSFLIFGSFGKILAQDVPPEERNALIDFYNSLDGNYWRVKTNWLSQSKVEDWYGVKVSLIENVPHITEISLPNNLLLGNVPNSIINLIKLNKLDLSQNDILSLPDEIVNLDLKDIRMNNNRIQKNLIFLQNNFPNLLWFDFRNNSIVSGDISKIFINKPNLQGVFIDGILTGNPDFSNNSKLKYLWLSSSATINVINLKNNFNINMVDGYASPPVIINVKNLKCMVVDSPFRASSNYQPYTRWRIDPKPNYESDCSAFLGLKEIKELSSMFVNPVESVLNIVTEKEGVAQIYSFTGQLVKTFPVKKGKNTTDVSYLQSGIYVLKLGNETAKIIKK